MTAEHEPAGQRKAGVADRFPALKKLRAYLRSVPEVRQLTATDCGAACLAMVLGYHGREITLEQARELTGVGRDGVTARTIIDAARRFGLRGRAVALDLDALSSVPRASILHWGFNHYVVFERLERNAVHLVDPALGRRRVSMEEFSRQFTGVVLLLEPAENFEQASVGRRGVLRYLLPLLRQSDVLGHVVALSAMLQLFALAAPALTGMVVDRVVPRGDYHLLLVLALALATLVLFQLLATAVRGHLLLEMRTRLDVGMTLGFLDHLVDLTYSFFQLRPAGDLMARMNTQATIRDNLSSVALSTILDGTLVLLYLVVLLIASPWMGLLVLGLGSAQVLVFLITRHRQRSLMSQSLELDAKTQSYQIAMLTGMQTLKAFGVERQAVETYSHFFVDMLNVILRRGRLNVWVDAVSSALRMASPLVLMTAGTYQVLSGSLTLGEMLSLNALAAALLVPLANLVQTASQFQVLGSYLERVNEVLDALPEQSPDHLGTPVQLQGAIELEKVSFRYSPTSPLVLQDVSLRVEPGQMVALVGRSGAGKTTLANVLLGLYLSTSGRVLYDGVDLRAVDLRALRGQMGIVLQDPAFFGSSLRDNIALGAPDLPLDRVVEAAKLAQIHEEIIAMPMQYDTLLLDRGLSLSGGQRQRLALARALVRSPAVLLLDEATSALDAVTESRVQETLAVLRCTRIVIAHRLSTIRSADLIVVLDSGRVVEVGKHDELLARDGAYRQLVMAQLEKTPVTPSLQGVGS